jgi:hypothetical protein
MNHPFNELIKANHRYRLRNSSRRILRSIVGENKKVANKTGSKLKGVVKKGDIKGKKRGLEKEEKRYKREKESRKEDLGRSGRLFPGSNMGTDILLVE